jgi:hypothetical protein
MSYEPTLIIRKKDLNTKKVIQLLETEQYCGDDEKEKIAQYLLKVNEYGTIKFDDVELVLCTPEFTSFNGLIREKLRELKVDFREDN